MTHEADVSDSDQQSGSESDESGSASEDLDLDRAQAQLEENGPRSEPESDVYGIEGDASQEQAQCDGQLQDEGGVRGADTPAAPAQTGIGLPVTGIGMTDVIEFSGRPKRRRVQRQQDIDALNGCLCGEVLQMSSDGVLKCKQVGCETQWVRKFF